MIDVELTTTTTVLVFRGLMEGVRNVARLLFAATSIPAVWIQRKKEQLRRELHIRSKLRGR